MYFWLKDEQVPPCTFCPARHLGVAPQKLEGKFTRNSTLFRLKPQTRAVKKPAACLNCFTCFSCQLKQRLIVESFMLKPMFTEFHQNSAKITFVPSPAGKERCFVPTDHFLWNLWDISSSRMLMAPVSEFDTQCSETFVYCSFRFLFTEKCQYTSKVLFAYSKMHGVKPVKAPQGLSLPWLL